MDKFMANRRMTYTRRRLITTALAHIEPLANVSYNWVNTRASTFTKFCKRLHEFQKSKRFRLHAITVLSFFSLSQIGKIANIFPKKRVL